MESVSPKELVEALDRAGIQADVRAGPFGQISGQVQNPGSDLYAGRPDAVVVVPADEDLLAPLGGRVSTAAGPLR